MTSEGEKKDYSLFCYNLHDAVYEANMQAEKLGHVIIEIRYIQII